MKNTNTRLAKQAIQHYMDSTNVSKDEATKRFEGLCMFLSLCNKTGNEEVASGPIDDIWHYALQFTEDYKKYCIKYFGKVIEHKPATILGQPSGYLDTRIKVVGMFGQLDLSIWPTEERQRWSVGYISK